MKYTLAKGLVKDTRSYNRNNGEYMSVKVNRKTGDIWGDYRISSDLAAWGKYYDDPNVVDVGNYAGNDVTEDDIIRGAKEAVDWANAVPEDFII